MCKVCKDDRCGGSYLLHPKEIEKLPFILQKELME